MKSFLHSFLGSLVAFVVGSVVLVVIGVIIISSIVALSSSDSVTDVKEKSVLTLKLDAQIVDRAEENPFASLELPGFQGQSKIGLNAILKNIEKAKKDDRIKGIYLTPKIIMAGYATVEEIRNALIDFKTSGKFIYSYSDTYTQKAYYLASVADSIIVNPEGVVGFRGLSAERTFYKGLLDKVGVEMQIIRHGKFKSAVEPYVRTSMSEASRIQTETYLGSIWDHVVKKVSEARKIDVEQLNAIADETTMLRDVQLAADNKLVTGLKYKDQVLEDLRALTGVKAKKPIPSVSISKYTKAVVPGKKKLHKDKIAVVYAEGAIDGTSEGIDSEKISKAIRKARLDSTIKAIVLRINSPGGSALGSDVMWREVVLAKKEKPVIASYGDVSASGGYYMSCAVDTIVASPTTITGSIGIFGMIPNASKLLEKKLGVTRDVVSTNKNSDLLSLKRAMTPFEKELFQERIESGYTTFISHVADGRGMTLKEVDKIGQGRVWSGVNAKEIGLVDVFGGLNTAIEIAKEKAKLDKYRVVAYPKLVDPFEKFIKGLSGNAKAMFFKNQLGEGYEYIQLLEKVKGMKGIQAAMPYELTIY